MVIILLTVNADLAHSVERHLAKVKVASSILVIRSRTKSTHSGAFCSGKADETQSGQFANGK